MRLPPWHEHEAKGGGDLRGAGEAQPGRVGFGKVFSLKVRPPSVFVMNEQNEPLAIPSDNLLSCSSGGKASRAIPGIVVEQAVEFGFAITSRNKPSAVNDFDSLLGVVNVFIVKKTTLGDDAAEQADGLFVLVFEDDQLKDVRVELPLPDAQKSFEAVSAAAEHFKRIGNSRLRNSISIPFGTRLRFTIRNDGCGDGLRLYLQLNDLEYHLVTYDKFYRALTDAFRAAKMSFDYTPLRLLRP